MQAESVTKMVRAIKKKKFPTGRLKVPPKPAHLGPKSPKSHNAAVDVEDDSADDDEDGDVSDADGAGEADEVDDDADADAEECVDEDGEDEDELTAEEEEGATTRNVILVKTVTGTLS